MESLLTDSITAEEGKTTNSKQREEAKRSSFRVCPDVKCSKLLKYDRIFMYKIGGRGTILLFYSKGTSQFVVRNCAT